MSDNEAEAHYSAGQRAAWLSILREALRHLGHDSPEVKSAAWVLEREELVRALRSVCAEHGDNDWPDSLHLGDVIEKHLARYLVELEPLDPAKLREEGRQWSAPIREASRAIENITAEDLKTVVK